MQVKLRLVEHNDPALPTKYSVEKKWLGFWLKQPVVQYYSYLHEELRTSNFTENVMVAEGCFKRLSQGAKIGYIPQSIPERTKVLKEFP